MTTIILDKKHFKTLMTIAQLEYEYWEKVNAKKKEKQCFNSLNACRIGILSEAAVKAHLMSVYSEELISINLYGLKERLKEKHFYNKPDIHLETYSKDLHIEVKGITKGQQRGQILKFHGDNYKKKGITDVAFCEVNYNLKEGSATVEIYLINKINKVVNYPISKNKFNVDCYTFNEYV
jgi:hypothetical protein